MTANSVIAEESRNPRIAITAPYTIDRAIRR
jgi:hypothetical protein